ncbi:hypothetical protein ACFFP0_06685 [Rhizobium puerariae]|uniref:Uncharacterized protein n=1 Tax=Rhizobium puerariae TaxID=1585791 RepID=A0ABV6AD21_9HYPH
MTGIFFRDGKEDVDWRAIAHGRTGFGLESHWGNRPLGHIDITNYDAANGVTNVLHFATWKPNRKLRIEGRSAGRAMALAFRDCVRTNLNCRRIVFRENHLEYAEIGYPSFFRSLGAVPRLNDRHPNRAAWHWDWSGDPVEGDEWLGRSDLPQ